MSNWKWWVSYMLIGAITLIVMVRNPLAAADTPNIVRIVSDDFGYGDAGIYGGGPSRRSGGSGQRDDGIPGTFPGYFHTHAQSMGPAEESDYRDSGSRGAGCSRSEWHRDSARAGRLCIVDPAHRRLCHHSRIARAAEPRALDSRRDDVLLAPQQLTANGWSVHQSAQP
jgi:hypothetical protein